MRFLPRQPSDAELVDRSLRNDPLAFEGLVHRYQRRAWAVALAAGLEPNSVADVVQEAFLNAFLHLGKLRDRGAFGAWLLAIVRNLARRGQKRSSEQALPEEVPGTEEPRADLESNEFNAYLWSKVKTLPLGVREAVWLYYYEGQRVRDVATTLEITIPAVKNRLQKGRTLLRETLWREIGQAIRDMIPSTREWQRRARHVSLAAIAAVPIGSTASGSTATAASVSFGQSTSSLPILASGVGLMSTKKIVGVAALCLGLFCVGFSVAYHDAGPSGETTRESGRVVDTEDRVAAIPDPPGSLEATRSPAPSEVVEENDPEGTNPTTGALRVQVLWHGSNDPASDVRISATPRRAPLPRLERWSALTNRDGEVVLEGLPPGDVYVESTRARVEPPGPPRRVRIAAGKERSLLLRLAEGTTVNGVVVDPEERPVPHAEIWVSQYDFDNLSARFIVRAGPDGTFTLRGVGSGRYVSARAPAYAPSSQRVPNGDRGDTVDMRLVLPGLGGEVEGQVFDHSGNPNPAAVVLVGLPSEANAAHVTSAAPFRTVTDSSGRFHASGVPTGEVPVVVRAPGLAPYTGTVVVDAARRSFMEVRLRVGASFTGHVLAASGEPIPGAEVSVGESFRMTRRSNVLFAEVRTDADGKFLLEGLPEGEQPVAVSTDFGKLKQRVQLLSGTVIEQDFIVRELAIRGRVVLEDGSPVAECEVSPMGAYTVFTDDTGRFQIKGCEDKGYDIHITEDGGHVPSKTLSDIRPREDEIEIVLLDSDRPTARFKGKIIRAKGGSIRNATVTFYCEERLGSTHARSGFFGGFKSDAVPSGEYMVWVEADELAGSWFGPFKARSEETVNLGALRLPDPGSLRVVVSTPSGSPDGLLLQSRTAEGRAEWTVSLGTDSTYEGRLVPGRHTLHLIRGKEQVVEADVEITAGSTTEVTLSVPDTVAPRES